MKIKYDKIMFAGPSGIGKTILAKIISEKFGYTYINGSVSHLIPSTKDICHQDMLERDKKTLYLEDVQVINLRNKLFKEQVDFVTDRSYLDSITYFLYKQSSTLPQCEVESFIGKCASLLTSQCDLLVVLELLPEYLHKWITEDNNKRVVSNYFQLHISQLNQLSLNLLDFKLLSENDYIGNFFNSKRLTYPYKYGRICNSFGSTDVLIIPNLNLDEREKILENQISNHSYSVF